VHSPRQNPGYANADRSFSSEMSKDMDLAGHPVWYHRPIRECVQPGIDLNDPRTDSH
jgi:hypothetical protein